MNSLRWRERERNGEVEEKEEEMTGHLSSASHQQPLEGLQDHLKDEDFLVFLGGH